MARENQAWHEIDWMVLAYFACIDALWAFLFCMAGLPVLWGNGSIHNVLQALAMLLVLGFPLAYPAIMFRRCFLAVQAERSC